ncbi:MAG: class I SAM-dependent methyltransferase [Flavobacterium sp.]|nr:MAG: class I SAM-dependent methyltransferase [Flavobacterium sp.]
MLHTSPQPSAESLSKYYESDAYISHTDSGRGLIAMLYQAIKKYSLRKKTGLIKKINKGPGSLLDIGAGTGAFLNSAKNKGWTIEGVEPNAKAREIASEKGIELLASMDDIADKQYHVVTLWHVLEHLPDLDKVVQNISTLVKPGGNLVVAVPNFKSYDAKYYKEYWAAYDTPRHLWHFSRTAVQKLFEKDFEFIESKPMLFDSFYVSLLSEKYKNGRSFSLGAIYRGLISNLKGRSTKEYSSHIYRFRKLQ